MPKTNSKINTDGESIVIINKAHNLEELFLDCENIKVDEKIKNNCIIIKDNENEYASVSFIDKKGNDTKFKVYVKGFKIE